MKQRLCRECKKVLPASRYFKCLDCQPSLASVEDTIYEEEELDEYTTTMCEDLFNYEGARHEDDTNEEAE